MKRFLILLSLLFCHTVYADTINLHWKNYDGTSYQESTCVVDSDLILPSTPPTRYGYTFTGWKITNYTPIEYLASTGTQWIDTGWYLPADKDNFEITLEFSNNGNQNRSWAVIGGVNLGGNGELQYYQFAFYQTELGRVSACNSNSFNNSRVFTLNSDIKNKFIMKYNGQTTIITNKNTDETQSLTGSLSERGTYSLYLFATHRPGHVADQFSKIKLYSYRISVDNTLVRDFIPALDLNGTPCLYDKVTEQFYYNSGTGQFVAGL